MKRVLITGAAGFIGAHLVKYILEETDWEIVCLDRYDTSGNINRLTQVITEDQKQRVKVVFHDLKAAINEFTSTAIGQVDYIVHLAAASHVDRSVLDPMAFIMDNVVGTTNLLIWAKGDGRVFEGLGGLKKGGKFLNFSTDETIGPAPVGVKHSELEPHKPSNPYAASKAGQEDIGHSFYISYGLPIITTRTMNNFGEMQHPEKLVPKTIRAVLGGTPMPIFARLNDDGVLEAVGGRIWIHAKNTASAIVFLLIKGEVGETYNVIGFDELTNLEIAEKIAAIIGKPLIPKYVDFYDVRRGYDLRYSLDGSKMQAMGWKAPMEFEEALESTVRWTVDHKEWK